MLNQVILILSSRDSSTVLSEIVFGKMQDEVHTNLVHDALFQELQAARSLVTGDFQWKRAQISCGSLHRTFWGDHLQ